MIQLKLQQATTIPLDLTGVLPGVLHKLSDAEIAKVAIRHGNRSVPLGEFFEIERVHEGVTDDPVLTIAGGCSIACNLGAGMDRGHLIVAGHTGANAFANMSGGWVSIERDAGDGLGTAMSGGSIWVGGNCGANIGAAIAGGRRGMTGGKIVVEGYAGDGVGTRMRRGSIHILGHCGAFAGAAMIAGTIRVDGRFGDHPGAGMKRGTLITRQELPDLPPGFRFACDYEPAYLGILDETLRGSRVRCYRGDMLAGGRGEIWQVIDPATTESTRAAG